MYLFLDVFSRKVVGWQVVEEESSLLASEVMRELCQREPIAQDPVVLHADKGGPRALGHPVSHPTRHATGAGRDALIQPSRRQQRQSLLGIAV